MFAQYLLSVWFFLLAGLFVCEGGRLPGRFLICIFSKILFFNIFIFYLFFFFLYRFFYFQLIFNDVRTFESREILKTQLNCKVLLCVVALYGWVASKAAQRCPQRSWSLWSKYLNVRSNINNIIGIVVIIRLNL